MRPTDERSLEDALKRSLERVPVPEIPWPAIRAKLHGWGTSGAHAWYARAAAALILLLAAAVGSSALIGRLAPLPAHIGTLLHKLAPLPWSSCKVYLSVQGVTPAQTLGIVLARSEVLAGTSQLLLVTDQENPSRGDVPCGSTVTFTETQFLSAKSFDGWHVSTSSGRSTVIKGSTLVIVVRSDVEVRALYTPRDH